MFGRSDSSHTLPCSQVSAGAAVLIGGRARGKGGGGDALCGTQAIVSHEVTGRSDPKSMRKQQLAPLQAPFSAERQLR